jgi:hypothetical protein
MFVLYCRNNIVPNWWCYHNATSCRYTVITCCQGVIILWRVREHHIAKSDFPRFPDVYIRRFIDGLELYVFSNVIIIIIISSIVFTSESTSTSTCPHLSPYSSTSSGSLQLCLCFSFFTREEKSAIDDDLDDNTMSKWNNALPENSPLWHLSPFEFV